MEMLWSWLRKRVLPSGAAALSACAASWPPAPGFVLDDHGLPQQRLQAFGQHAGDGVRAAAGREAHQQAQRAPLLARAAEGPRVARGSEGERLVRRSSMVRLLWLTVTAATLAA